MNLFRFFQSRVFKVGILAFGMASMFGCGRGAGNSIGAAFAKKTTASAAIAVPSIQPRLVENSLQPLLGKPAPKGASQLPLASTTKPDRQASRMAAGGILRSTRNGRSDSSAAQPAINAAATAHFWKEYVQALEVALPTTDLAQVDLAQLKVRLARVRALPVDSIDRDVVDMIHRHLDETMQTIDELQALPPAPSRHQRRDRIEDDDEAALHAGRILLKEFVRRVQQDPKSAIHVSILDVLELSAQERHDREALTQIQKLRIILGREQARIDEALIMYGRMCERYPGEQWYLGPQG